MKMNYFVFGTNNMKDAVKFYDEIFKDNEITKLHDEGRMTLWGGTSFMFALAEPFDGDKATSGNGNMVGFNLLTEKEVERLHTKALNMGGKDEGSPKIRSGKFSAYFRDLDNNKVCLYT